MSAKVNQRGSESKYVSLFADSRPDVDVTFRDPLLTRPTSHYVVGVDNLSVASRALSMIEPIETAHHTDLLRVVRKPTVNAAGGNNRGQDSDADDPAGSRTLSQNIVIDGPHTIGYAHLQQNLVNAAVPSSRVVHSAQELMEHLQTVAKVVNSTMSSGALVAAAADGVAQTFPAYVPDQEEKDDEDGRDHLVFRLSSAGKLIIEGTKAFWSVCAIEVPTVQNQYGFYSAIKSRTGPFYAQTGRRFLTVDPAAGEHSWGNLVCIKETMSIEPRVCGIQTVHHGGGVSTLLQGANDGGNSFFSGASAASKEKIVMTLEGNIFLGLDRRVAVELGTSLPIKNSPMITHQDESPDFVIGRWIYRNDNTYTINDKGVNATHSHDVKVITEYQGAQDRVVFHELMPQSKVQTLRVRLFARVRSFDVATETYNVRVIELPTNAEDWWHGRLHFVSKD